VATNIKINLHLSVSAYGKDFLVDSGRFALLPVKVAEKFRPLFAKGSAGHNLDF